MAKKFKRKHGITLALSLTIVLLLGCISLVSYQMYKTALKSFSVQDTSTNLPEKLTDSTTIFNTTETPFQETTTATTKDKLNQVSKDQEVKDTIFIKTTPNITGKSYRCPKFDSHAMQTLEIRVEQKRNRMTIFKNLIKMKRHFLKPKRVD